MKKIIIFVLIIFLLIYFFYLFHTAKKEENIVQLGVECEIIDVNRSDKTLTIIGADSGRKIIQQESKIDCKDLEKDGKIVKFNSSNQPNILKFDDLKQSDRIKINIDEKQLQNNNEFLKVKQIELVNKN
ncbi:hypothetical protein [Finegoldia magna]|uniref:DUF3221 domain-containing protein n=1 Tax=Finegoldia magna (strain ATCC 29328 / DSM 20472 / WAL 2508) TaxID=334413 RepID=B0S3G9_FINM2|nr:hypothetical protein [Finegoldia magna]UEA69750.1 hypothetical protein LK415_06005 [Finegoldia magna]BAG08909.1 hypothetical protein FMG_1491 [Finegoldia magna ATCC 29328]